MIMSVPPKWDAVDCSKHQILLTDFQIKKKPYGISTKAFPELLDEMIESKVIKCSPSPWASSVVIVPKKIGKHRFCENQITRHQLIPTIQEIPGSLAGFSGYWQVQMLHLHSSLIDMVLGKLKRCLCLVYLGDITIYPTSWQHRLMAVKAVNDKLWEAGLTVNVTCCVFEHVRSRPGKNTGCTSLPSVHQQIGIIGLCQISLKMP